MGSRLMPLPRLQIYLWHSVNWIFDLLTPNVDCIITLSHEPLMPSKSVYSVSKYCVCQFGNKGADIKMDG